MRGRLVPALLVLLLTTGCVPPSPDASGWTDQAQRTVEAVASEVASTRVMLGEEADDDLLGKAAVVMAVESEEAAGSDAESFSATQPPAGLEQQYDDVVAALEEATGLLARARIAVAAGRRDAYARLRGDLDRVGARLGALAQDLGR